MADIYRQNAYLNALHNTALALMNNLETRELLESMIRQAGDLVGTENGFVALLDEGTDKFTLKVALGFYVGHVGNVITPGFGVMGQVLLTGETCIVNNYSSWPMRMAGTEYDPLYSVIGMPLKANGQLVGIIGLGHIEAKEFSIEECNVLSRFADLASIALTNSKLYTALQQELAERRLFEKKLQYISYHDALTGLYNRAYFKREMARLESAKQKVAGIILCDVDGLKLINDTLGHEQGDCLLNAAAEIIKANISSSDIAARIGGDEFAILLSDADSELLEDLCDKLRNAVDMYNVGHLELPLSMSVGYAVGGGGDGAAIHMDELFREADDNMYREKLHRSRSTRSAIVKALLKALEVRDFITEGHGDRMQLFAGDLASTLELSERRIDDIKLLAQFHDIGKVGIPDRILFKPGTLTLKEQVEMQRHADIGYRIAQSISDLIPIADFILKHHEWWNGNGYPIGLKGEEIPLECRIIAIADAYDAMTSDRPYRKALPAEAAVAELRRQAGSQFDPALVAIFCGFVENRYRRDGF